MSDTQEEIGSVKKTKLRKKAVVISSIGLFLVGALISFGVTSMINTLNQPKEKPEEKSVSIDGGKFAMRLVIDDRPVVLSLEASVDVAPGSGVKSISQVRDVLLQSAAEAAQIPLTMQQYKSDEALSGALNLIAKTYSPWIEAVHLTRLSEK